MKDFPENRPLLPASDDAPLSQLLRPSEVTELLGVSRTWLYAAAKDGRIPWRAPRRTGRPGQVVSSDLSAWLGRAREGWLPGESLAETSKRAAA